MAKAIGGKASTAKSRTVREAAGLCDVSTLGKIEIFGNDAQNSSTAIYCNGFANLPVGKARYGLMLREDGMVYDDGTTSRLAEDHFFMTTTTALAGEVMTHLEFCAQVRLARARCPPGLGDRPVGAIGDRGTKGARDPAGGRRRRLSNSSFPSSPARSRFRCSAAKSRRASTGSPSPANLATSSACRRAYGEWVADRLMEDGRPHGLCAYGAEALGVLRIEKGHITHAEINGAVTPARSRLR